jgi:membrane-associated protein
MIPGLELTELLKSIGIIGITVIIFLESGIPFGFIFPGDSLLFTAGVLAAAGVLNLPLLIICVFLAAILGVNAGYAFGKRYGRRLFSKDKSIFFHKDYINRAEEFYEEHGGKAIIFARFIPVVRTFAPIVAGIGNMNYRRFMFFNIIGAVIWAVGVTTLGYWLGSKVPADIMEKYLLLIVFGFIVLSFIPAIVHVLRDPKSRAALAAKFRRD